MGQESSQWDWIHVDEPIPEAMWIANSRGLMDTGGSAWFTCTPIAEQWINKFFLPTKLMRSSFEGGFPGTNTDVDYNMGPSATSQGISLTPDQTVTQIIIRLRF